MGIYRREKERRRKGERKGVYARIKLNPSDTPVEHSFANTRASTTYIAYEGACGRRTQLCLACFALLCLTLPCFALACLALPCLVSPCLVLIRLVLLCSWVFHEFHGNKFHYSSFNANINLHVDLFLRNSFVLAIRDEKGVWKNLWFHVIFVE